MAQLSEKKVQRTRFKIAELQTRIRVLEVTREDMERQMRKLTDSVPEDNVDANEQRDGYVAYGSYAQSVIARKDNLRRSLDDIIDQTSTLSGDLRLELDALDSFERVNARRMAQQGEREQRRTAG